MPLQLQVTDSFNIIEVYENSFQIINEKTVSNSNF